MTVEADPETGVFRLVYTHAGETLTVLVRLGEPKMESDPVKVAFKGEILHSSRQDSETFDGMLVPNEAVVMLEKG